MVFLCPVILSHIVRRIRDVRFGKSFFSQFAGIALPARAAQRVRIVATERLRVVHTKANTFADDLSLRHLQQRSVDEAKRQEFYQVMVDDCDRLLGTVEQAPAS